MKPPDKDQPDNFLESCLFFNTNALSRYLLKLAEAQFKPLKISPAHASLLLIVYDTPGISPKELSKRLHLTPSTISRFLEALGKKSLLHRKSKGKTAFIYPSQKGLEIKSQVALAYKNLCLKYTKILGHQFSEQLSSGILNANQKLSDYFLTHEKKL